MLDMAHTPWYRDGLVWTVLAFVIAAFLIGMLIGQYVKL